MKRPPAPSTTEAVTLKRQKTTSFSQSSVQSSKPQKSFTAMSSVSHPKAPPLSAKQLKVFQYLLNDMAHNLMNSSDIYD